MWQKPLYYTQEHCCRCGAGQTSRFYTEPWRIRFLCQDTPTIPPLLSSSGAYSHKQNNKHLMTWLIRNTRHIHIWTSQAHPDNPTETGIKILKLKSKYVTMICGMSPIHIHVKHIHSQFVACFFNICSGPVAYWIACFLQGFSQAAPVSSNSEKQALNWLETFNCT